jgi:hypothetical protein
MAIPVEEEACHSREGGSVRLIAERRSPRKFREGARGQLVNFAYGGPWLFGRDWQAQWLRGRDPPLKAGEFANQIFDTS